MEIARPWIVYVEGKRALGRFITQRDAIAWGNAAFSHGVTKWYVAYERDDSLSPRLVAEMLEVERRF